MPSLTEQQRKAVQTIDHNVLVSAGAGSGKTMVLVERYIEVLRRHADASISDLVAVTFTRKAAEEMRSRLKIRLKEIVDAARGKEKERWSTILGDVDHARIGTIHSLCDSILKAFPADAGVDPQFELLDDLSRAELLARSIDEVLSEIILAPCAEHELLLDYPIELIKNWILPLLAAAPQYKEARSKMGTLSAEELTDFVEALIARTKTNALKAIGRHTTLRACLDYLRDSPFVDEKSPLEDRRREALALLKTIMLEPSAVAGEDAGLLQAETCLRELSLFKIGNVGGQKGKSLREVLKRARALAEEIIAPLPSGLNPCDREAFVLIRAIITVADSALARYESLKQKFQKADFNDLIERTHYLLTSRSSPARRHFNERLKAILVDEFQDTNRIQARLVASLCGQDGYLFLIGDDKQSIYRFQGADVATFNEWKTILRQGTTAFEEKPPAFAPEDADPAITGKGLLLDLSYSFRSHPTIVAFVNCLFKHFFQEKEEGQKYRAQHQALSPSRQDLEDPGRIEVIIFDPRQAEEEKRQSLAVRLFEGQIIAAWIKEKIAGKAPVYEKAQGNYRPISYGDFAILVQANSDFAAIESVLSDEQIPYVTMAGTGFLDRQEILDLESLLRWLSCPVDDHALLCVLRSPFFSISDDIIQRLFAGKKTSLWRQVQIQAQKQVQAPEDQGSSAKLQSPVEALKALQSAAQRENLGQLVRTIILQTSIDVVLEALPNGKQRSRNIWKLAAMAEEHSHMSPDQFVQALDAMRALKVTSQTEAPLNTEDSVKLMTIHKSKGLEFPAVILPAMGRPIHRYSGKLLLHKDFGLSFDPTRDKDDEKPAFFQIATHLNRQMEEAEKQRLLYVAMTRARDYLGIPLEKELKNHQSFRLWLLERLKSTGQAEDEELPASGVRSLKAEQEEASYTVEWIDRQTLGAWQKEILLKEGFSLVEPEEVVPAPEHHMIASLVAGAPEAPFSVPWQRLERISATPDNPAPHQTVTGTYFHALMQSLVQNLERPTVEALKNLTLSAEIKAFDRQFSNYLVKEAQRLIDIFFDSDLFYQLLSARRRLSEIPYMVLSAPGSALDRRVDLIIEDGVGNWHIIDFKTDKIEAWQVEQKAREHSEQLLEYVFHFKQLTGILARAWVYFAQNGKLHEVESMPPSENQQDSSSP